MTTLSPSGSPKTPASHAGAAHRPGGRIAFITGCGRSGTTILGRVLSKHRDVMVLNDQHMLWAQAWPQYDVGGWVPFDPARPAPLMLTSEDAGRDPDAAARFRAMLEERRDGRPVLVEKITHNTMRMGFLRALVPGCLIIHIARHGVEVACSIARQAAVGDWYGLRDRKWHSLVAHANAHGYGRLLPLCTGPEQRGLLEWRMYVDASDDYFARDPVNTLHLRYEDLVAHPAAACENLERFLGIILRPVMREFAATRIARQSPTADQQTAPEHTDAIAGPALRRLGYWS